MSENGLRIDRFGFKEPSASVAFQLATLGELLGVGDKLDQDFAEKLQGSYNLLRPSRTEPKSKVNVGRLIIGGDAKTTNEAHGYSASYEFFDDLEVSLPSRFEGVILPSKDFTLMLLNSRHGGHRLQAVFDRTKDGANRLPPTTDIQQLRGNLLYNIVNKFGPKEGGAYPVFACRTASLTKEFADFPHALVREKFGYDAWDRMRRGAIYERDCDFPTIQSR
jgi:hypothetical protein